VAYFVALLAGLALAVMTVAIGRGGAAHFNPAVTIGMWTVRQIKTLPAVAYIVAQLVGAFGAYYLYTYFAKTSLPAIGGSYDSRIMVAEAVGTFVLSLAWAAAVFNRFRGSKTAVTLGAGYALAIVLASSASIGVVNPAVALGIRAFTPTMGWATWGTYVLGPVLGALVGFNLYALLFAPENSFAAVKAVVSGLNQTKASTAAPAKAAPATTAKAAPKKRATTRSSSRSRSSRKAK
jgi:glycerol uptake facilitator protein